MSLVLVAALAAGWFAFWTSDAPSPTPVALTSARCVHGGLAHATFFGGPAPLFVAFRASGPLSISIAGEGHVRMRIAGRVATSFRADGCETVSTALSRTEHIGVELGIGTTLAGIAGATTPDPPPADAPRAIFLGDSVTLGAGGDAPPGYAYRAGWAKGWSVRLDAQVGTGFLNRAGKATYAERLPAVLAQHPKIVVVAGGINDYRNFTNAQIARAASTLFAKVRAAGARLIVISPWEPPRFQLASYADLVARIGRAARQNGAHYIDTSSWLTPALMSPDRIHPNERGYRAIAKKLALRL